jgi:DNA polymerase-1
MIENLRRKYKPDYMAVAFDGPGELVRSGIYREYKANRPPMPDDLQRQLPLIHELLQALGIPEISVPGQEADDLLGAVARQAVERGIDTIIVTTDKDAEQVIDGHTRVLHVHKDREVMLDPAGLKEEKGIEPWQVVEVMALAGDPTDNVPGVPGIGPKTALKLIQQFGSVENLYTRLSEVKSQNLREKLAEHRKDVEVAAKLVRLNCNIPLELDIEECTASRAEPTKANEFYRALGFRSLLHEEAAGTARGLAARGQAGARPPAAPRKQGSLFAEDAGEHSEAVLESIESLEKDYSVITSLHELAELVETLGRQEVIAVDTETTSLQPRDAKLVGLSFSWRDHQGVYVATLGPAGEEFCPMGEGLRMLKPVLEAESPAKVGQNLKYDIAVLKNYGLGLGGLHCDAMVASYLLQPSTRSHNLDALARRHLSYRTVKIEELIGKGAKQITMDQVPVSKVGPYSCEDADVSFQLCRKLLEELSEDDLRDLFERLELPLVPVLADMEWVGVKVDVAQLEAISTEFAGKLAELERDIFREAGREFNINSPQQLSEVLFEKMGLPAPRGGRRTTGYSTASEVLEALKGDYAIADLLLQHRQLDKLKSTYADALLAMVNSKTGRVHTSFNQTVTATGRLSSSDPNLQNIPVRTPLGRRIRRAFVAGADDWSLLSADYSQIELRMVAHCSGDPALRKAFEEDRDIHRFVAAQVNGIPEADVTEEMRQHAKAVNFGIIYGLSPYGLSRQIGIPTEEAEQFIANYFARYPKVKEFIDRAIAQAHRDGYVRTLAGRRRKIEGLHTSGATRKAAERIAVNTVVQGSAADLIKLAMIEIHRGLPGVSSRANMLIQIHDELVFEAPDDELEAVTRFVTDKMSGALELDVPLKVAVATGKNWADAK